MGVSLSQCFIKFFSLSFLFTFLLFPPSAPAELIDMEHTLGFNGVFKLKDWAPLTVVIENRHKGIQGQLEVVVTSGSEYQKDVSHTSYSRDVDLPTQSKKTYGFTIFIDSYVHPLIIRLKKEKEIILSKSINLREQYTNKPLLIFVGENLKDLSPLDTEEYQTVYTPVRFLPETWYGYHGVKGLILKTGVWKNLQPRQYAGITQWIKSGGYVITSGGVQETSLSMERLEQLTSVRVVGLEQVREIPALQAFCGIRLMHRDPFLLLKVTAPQAKTILRDRDLSLILEKGLGFGKILFLAFDVTDPSFRDWPGRGAFWEKIIQQGPAAEATQFHPKEDQLYSLLLSNIPAQFPSFLILFPLLLGYILLINFLMKTIPNKRKRALRTLLPLGLTIFLVSSSCFGLSYFSQVKYKLFSNGLLHLKMTGQQTLAQWKYYWGIYTQKEGEFRQPLGAEDLPLTGIPTHDSEAYDFHNYTLHESEETRSLLFPLHRWSHRSFSLTGFGEFPLQARAQFQEENLSLSIENRSSFPILNCFIYFGGRLLAFGNIAPKEKLIKKWNLRTLAPQNVFTSKEVETILKGGQENRTGSFSKEMEMEFIKDLWISIHEENQWRGDRIFLIGWIDSLIFPTPTKQQTPFRNSVNVLEWEISLKTGPGQG
jgi:hypothetical protein